MKRRELLGVIGGAAAWPLGVWAQQPKNVPRIGLLLTGSIESPEARAALKAVFDAMMRSTLRRISSLARAGNRSTFKSAARTSTNTL